MQDPAPFNPDSMNRKIQKMRGIDGQSFSCFLSSYDFVNFVTRMIPTLSLNIKKLYFMHEKAQKTHTIEVNFNN